jgi:hypothetical protein
MLGPGSRGDGRIRPDGEDTKRIIGTGLDAWPWFDHVISPFSTRALILFVSMSFVKSPFVYVSIFFPAMKIKA